MGVEPADGSTAALVLAGVDDVAVLDVVGLALDDELAGGVLAGEDDVMVFVTVEGFVEESSPPPHAVSRNRGVAARARARFMHGA